MKTYLVRPIDANELKEKICNNVYPVRDSFNNTDYGMFWTGGIEKIIDEQPTIDAVPVKRGMWNIGKTLEKRWKNVGKTLEKAYNLQDENKSKRSG